MSLIGFVVLLGLKLWLVIRLGFLGARVKTGVIVIYLNYEFSSGIISNLTANAGRKAITGVCKLA